MSFRQLAVMEQENILGGQGNTLVLFVLLPKSPVLMNLWIACCRRQRDNCTKCWGWPKSDPPCDGLDDCDSSKLAVQQVQKCSRRFRPALEQLANERPFFSKQ